MLRDLFQRDGGGWLQDPALLDRLMLERFDREASVVRAEGGWVTTVPTLSYGHTEGLRRLPGEVRPLRDDEQAARDALQAEYDGLVAAHEDADDLPEEIAQRLEAIEEAIALIDERPLVYDAAAMARAGAFVSIGYDGDLRVERGFVRRADEVRPTAAIDDPGEQSGEARDAEIGGTTSLAAPDEADEGDRPLPERLVAELTAHRTLALRDALSIDPDTAFLAVLQTSCWRRFTTRRRQAAST